MSSKDIIETNDQQEHKKRLRRERQARYRAKVRSSPPSTVDNLSKISPPGFICTHTVMTKEQSERYLATMGEAKGQYLIDQLEKLYPLDPKKFAKIQNHYALLVDWDLKKTKAGYEFIDDEEFKRKGPGYYKK